MKKKSSVEKCIKKWTSHWQLSAKDFFIWPEELKFSAVGEKDRRIQMKQNKKKQSEVKGEQWKGAAPKASEWEDFKR